MASKDAANALQANRTRPGAPRSIVPAIPLPYIQKRKQVTQEKQHEQNASEPSAAKPSVTTTTVAKPALGLAPSGNGGAAATISSNDTSQLLRQDRTKDKDQVVAQNPAEKQIAAAAADTKPTVDHSSPQSPLEVQSPETRPSTSIPSQPPSRRQSIQIAVALPLRPAIPNRNMHGNNPSVGSMMFGGYSDSNNSSPVPPMSAGDTQPLPSHYQVDTSSVYSPPFPNGGRHVHQFSNGHIPMGPPGLPFPHSTGPNNMAGRQVMSFGPTEGSSSAGTPAGFENYRAGAQDFTAPHSFHGSQSSHPTEYEGLGLHEATLYPMGPMANGSNGPVDLHQQPRHRMPGAPQHGHYASNSHMSQNMMQPPLHSNVDNLDGLVEYIRSQFSDPQYADYTLELRYSDDRAAPVRIQGHNLLFARSPALKTLMLAQSPTAGDSMVNHKTLFIESDDRFIRSDAFWMAVQRLYGCPLLDARASMITSLPNSAHMVPGTPGSPTDRFDFALGYAASGHLLRMPPVLHRGIEIASHLIGWSVLEKALDFALDGTMGVPLQSGHLGPHGPIGTYGPAADILIDQALNFIIASFPPDFELDTAVPPPAYSGRLPEVPKHRATRLNAIRFGDHSREDSEDTTRQSGGSSIVNSILSKILLNLQFDLLRRVLESSRLGNVHGWATTALRAKVMHAVVEEREKRRVAVKESKHVAVPEASMAGTIQWQNVFWQEKVTTPPGGGDAPVLTRVWIG